jgi:oligopeptidase B
MASTALAVSAAAALTGILSYRRALRMRAPRAKRVLAHVLVGAVPGSVRVPAGETAMSPPIALVDDLLWLRDDERTSPAVLAHLVAENAYTALRTAGLRGEVECLYAELLSRVKETDASLPYVHGPWSYYTRQVKGLSYSLHCRVPRAMQVSAAAQGATVGLPLSVVVAADGRALEGEEVLLDENVVAAGSKQCDVSCVELSPDHRLLAFTSDFTGSETYTVRVKVAAGPSPALGAAGWNAADSPAGSLLPDVLEGVDGGVVWGASNAELYYCTLDEAHRPYKAWRHVLGQMQSEDTLLFTEEDERFWIGLEKSSDEGYVFVSSSSKTSSEVLAVPLDGRTPFLVQSRLPDVLYEVGSLRPAHFLIVTNHQGAKNFKIVVSPVATPDAVHWVDLLPASLSLKVDGVSIFSSFVAVHGRQGGYKNLWIMSTTEITAFAAAAYSSSSPARVAPGALAAVSLTRIPPAHEVFVMSFSGGNEDFDALRMRYGYGSPVTPSATCELDVQAALPPPAVRGADGWAGIVADAPPSASIVLRRKEVPNCEPSNYATARIWATAADGTRVPVSIVYRPDAHEMASGVTPSPSGCPLALPAPLLLYGYGSYGHSIDLPFNSSVLSLLDRGVVYAVAHVRGGGEMGRAWYEDEGKLMTKKNTFTDFVSVAEALVATGWARPGAMGAMGASAGGLLVGAVINARPDLFAAVVSQVGFVDVVQSVADPSIPLAVTEWEEWGCPNEAVAFKYMRSYSPLDNVKTQAYPHVLLTAGLHDSRVAFWEPAKFAQRLRDANTGLSEILLKVEMGAGHFSAADRYAYLKEKALEYAWLLSKIAPRKAA